MKYRFLPLGILFGFLLSRAGATTFDFYAGLFLFEDLQLLEVIAVAVGVGAIGVYFMQHYRAKTIFEQQPIAFKPKPWRRSLVPGALVHGMGWGLAGACPGTALAMFGEGKLAAGFTIVGILLGTYLHGRIYARVSTPRATQASALSVQ